MIVARRIPERRLRLMAMLLGLFLPGAAAKLAAQEDELAKELPRISARTPAESVKSFRIHDGFHLEAVAVEPMVMNPVSVCYDAHGRLYVVEMRDYPFPEKNPSGRVIRLEDRDGDGRFETRTVFLEGLSWPTGIVPYAGGVFIAAAPEILYAKDTNGDGVADVRNVMFSGFRHRQRSGAVERAALGPGWLDLRCGERERRHDPESIAARKGSGVGSRARLSLQAGRLGF